MYQRKLCFLSAAFVLGVAAAEYDFWLLRCFLAGYMAVWGWCVWHAPGGEKPKTQAVRLFWIGAMAAAICGGGYASFWGQTVRQAYEERLQDGKACLLQGEIYQRENSQIENQSNTYLYYLKKCRIQLDQTQYPCNKVIVSLSDSGYSVGEILCVKGKIKTFSQPANEGNYDEKGYYQSLKTDVKVQADAILSVHGKKNEFKERLLGIRQKLADSYHNAMPDADAGVLLAMVLGDKSEMDQERKELYQKAGISHFYSISGLHISMLGMALYGVLKKRGASFGVSGGLAAALILTYGAMIGYGISAARAIGMIFVLVYARYRGRSYDRPTALALMAAALAAENPGILHHAGYLLSFGAVTGVILAEFILKDKTGEKNGTLPGAYLEGVRETFVVSVCIQLVTIPVLCQYFYEISIYAIFINLIILPCMGVLLGMGVLGGAVGCFFPFAGKLLLYPCYLILLLFEAVCRVFLKLPYASLIVGTLSVGRILLWYGLLAAFLLLYKRGKLQSLSICAVGLAFCALLLAPKSQGFELDFLDVGQGDGIFLSTEDHTAVFIDGGSTDVKKVGTYRILPFLKSRGIRRVDYWFVSHCDADHINGLCEVIEAGYPIRYLVAAEYLPEDEAWQALQNLAEKKQIPILKMKPQDEIRSKKDIWRIRCLSPEKQDKMADRNENSLVLYYEDVFCSGFFAGDIGMETEKKLAEKGNLSNVDIYKASHHGSDYSNGTELLDVLLPAITVVSCSLRNSYGHPGRKAMERLDETGTRIYQTRHSGQIKITRHNSRSTRLQVVSFRQNGMQ